MSHVNTVKRIAIHPFAGTDVLSGALRGQELLTHLLRETATENEPTAPQSVFLDFADIKVATASYLRESVVAFRDFVRGRRSLFYPVIANANAAVKEELNELAKSRGGVILACDLAGDDTISNPTVIGQLDPKQKLTFDMVRQRGETDALELRREAAENAKPTAWNNRLASLVALGLIVEMTSGRTKRYKPLLQGL